MQVVRGSGLLSHKSRVGDCGWPGSVDEIDIRTGVSGRLELRTQVNALVKQGNALSTAGDFALPDLLRRWDEAICRSPAHGGCGGRGRS